MATTKKTTNGPRMSDEAVKAKTGKAWKEWFAILDKAGARKMTHREIVNVLSSEYAVGPWWQQMVTVTYEQERGLRALHQKPAGYEISISRTIKAPLNTLFKAFATENSRSRWLAEEGLVVRKSTANKSMRVTWKDGKTSVGIDFYPKSDFSSQVVVQHSKLPDAKAAAKMKIYWSKKLNQLRASLE